MNRGGFVGEAGPTPDQTINLDNAAWGGVGVEGVETADLGLFQGTGTFQSAELNNVVVFDEFDSRRTTAIGP